MSSATKAPSSSLQEFKRIEPEECFRQQLAQGVRPDGRTSTLGLRPVSLSVGNVSAADGSAVVRQGNTVVTCGVTLELAAPRAEEPDRGFVVPNVDLPPLCHSRFKPGPPSEQAQVSSQFISEVIDNSGLLDRRDLCVVPGRLAWVVCIELVCLNYDGNVLDASVKAMVAALRNVMVPEVTLEDEEEGVEAEAPSASMENLKVFGKRRRPLKLGPQPACCTMAVFDGKLLVDPTDEEEALSSAQVTVVLGADGDDDGKESVVHFRKAGGSAVTRETVSECTSIARRQAKRIRKMLDKAAPMNKI